MTAQKNRFPKLLSLGIVFLAALVLVTACAPASPLSPELQLQTVVALTLTAHPTYTPIPTFTALPPPTATSPPTVNASEPYTVRTVVQNVNLRTGPGTLFTVSRVMPQGTRLMVLGLAPGGEWISVLNEEGIRGWVGVWVVNEFPLQGFETVEPVDVQRVTGHVLDANGSPVSGIGFSFVKVGASDSPPAAALTDATGTFYAFLPKNAPGSWNVSHSSVACTSNTMDANCNCLNGICGAAYPQSVTVNLPLTAPLSFTWK